MKVHTTLTSLLLIGASINYVDAQTITTYPCPSAGQQSILPISSTATTSITIRVPIISDPNGLCTLTRHNVVTGNAPVARSYSNRSWELTAGLFATTDSGVSIDCDAGSIHECEVTLPPLTDDGEEYILTSYDHSGDARVKAARFLEQSTFGASLEEIDDLAATANNDNSSPNFTSWITSQMSPDLKTSHRAFFRLNTNPRVEYPYYGAGASPTTPCSITSRWRTFALSERDGVVSIKTYQNKMLNIDYENGRYIWYVDGMARTSTSSLDYVYDVDGNRGERLRTNTAYQINSGNGSYQNDNSKYSCVGCPVRVCRVYFDGDRMKTECNYLKNPSVDATGIENTHRMGYDVIELPDTNDGMGNMVGIDDAVDYQVMEYKKSGDEFWLNATIDQSQCNALPENFPQRPQETQFDAARFGMLPFMRMESALPTVMGRTYDHLQDKMITVAFDPIIEFRENTIDNPIPDGGGQNNLNTKDWYGSPEEDGFCWPGRTGCDHPVRDGAIHCANVRRTFLNEASCKLSFAPTACTQPDEVDWVPYRPNPYVYPTFGNGKGVVVCGSPEEVANDFTNGVVDGFDQKSWSERSALREIYKEEAQTEQKYTLWSHIALRAKDQLRQRVAWILYQILPVATPGGHNGETEIWALYYDVFVRHAFGNYRNVLKEISFNSVMSNWLSYRKSASLQHAINLGSEVYPDENYAREIMQLFSIGLFKLNMNGTRQTDSEGNFIYTYDSDVIMSYARAWTGFNYQYYRRGNVESEHYAMERIDPLVITRETRDVFPKIDMNGGYIGDGFPLCEDLPDRMHLRKGATFLVLGSTSNPEQQYEDPSWDMNSNVARLELDSNASPLQAMLCAAGPDGICTYPGKVILDQSLVYDTPSLRALAEHDSVNEVRTVQVTGGVAPVFYEYLRPPCVHKNFFNGAKKVISGSDIMCADPNVAVAAGSCCSNDNSSTGLHLCNYAGERTNFASAVEKCMANGYNHCTPTSWAGGDTCTDDQTYSWTSSDCQTRAKISFDTREVARVDYPGTNTNNVKNLVHEGSINYVRVQWTNEGSLPIDVASCDALQTCYSVSDGCVCDTDTTDSVAFATVDSIGSKESILQTLRTGSVDPNLFDLGVYTSIGECVPGVHIYSKTASNCGDTLDTDTIFNLLDGNGIRRNFKNTMSTVHIVSTSAYFRNPVHFIDFLNLNLRDMYHETDAVLDSYFHHPSHAPFMALRFCQRFGISNPSPAYIERVATAYKSGIYQSIGSGEYGDLGAMVASVLLDDESRQVVLDQDPSHGHIREPLLKIFGLMKAMKASRWAPLSVPLFTQNIHQMIGQGPYRTPSVFSFFKPEFSTSSTGDVGLVAPEAEILKGDMVINMLNGMWSMMNWGLSQCYGGFKRKGWGVACAKQEGRQQTDATATLTYEADSNASIDGVLNELALILTAGRLSDSNRIIVRNAMQNTFDSGDLAKAVRIAVKLIVSSPEFSSTNVARNTGLPTPITGYVDAPSGQYKAIVYYYLAGGLDSFNLLVPKANCLDGRDVYSEYKSARGLLALDENDLVDIDATGSNQVCDTFAVNKNHGLIHELYSAGEALLVANMGVLSKPLTKHDDYGSESNVGLFAHNHMMSENLKCDIFDGAAGTGVGGRILDTLKRQGYHTSANTVDGMDLMLQGSGRDNNPVWDVPVRDPTQIDQYSSVGSNMLDLVKSINGIGSNDNGFFANTWSASTSKALFEYEKSLEYAELFELPEYDMDYPTSLDKTYMRFRSLAQYIKMRDVRKVNREVFYIQHDGFDSHSETVEEVNLLLKDSDNAIRQFVEEMKAQQLWDNVVIIMASDFGRSITPNSSGGSDHAWGGNYYLLGGSIKGQQIIGQYPDYLSKVSDTWISRGRLIPTTPWDAVWHGIAQWMGVLDNEDISAILPNMANFRKCDMYTDQDLFVNGQVPSYDCDAFPTATPTTKNPTTESPTISAFPTQTPTTAVPSLSPTTASPVTGSPTSLTQPLEYIGNEYTNGFYGKCQGDCDDDSDCTGQLLCFQRTNFDDVPGCSGANLYQRDDFCFQRPANYLWVTGNNGIPASAFPMGACDGDCDSDSDCTSGLLCLQRLEDEVVPGCDGPGVSGQDYCYDPTPIQTASPSKNPTNAVTPNPTNIPTNAVTPNPTEITTANPTTANPTTANPTTANPVTPAPTNDPTPIHTPQPQGGSIPLQAVFTGRRAPPSPLTECQGDCDNDSHCSFPLRCFQRDGIEEVPGCSGEGDTGMDYCWRRPTENTYWTMGNNQEPVEAFPLGHCEADCDGDEDCAPGLVCFQRGGDEHVPDCIGTAETGQDYCYDPNLNSTPSPTSDPVTPSPTTNVPTSSPTTASTTASPVTGSPSSSTQPLQNIGQGQTNGYYGPCQGDCDRDSDCSSDLLCFQRDNFENVPGCSGANLNQKDDFCFQRPVNYLWVTGNNGSPASAFPMGACDGDCDDDDDCTLGLLCLQRLGDEVVPGCDGPAVSGQDYCYDPSL